MLFVRFEESLERRVLVLLLGSLKALVNILPLYNVPYGFNVVGSDVFVLEIVRVFPDINAKQWDETFKIKGRCERSRC